MSDKELDGKLDQAKGKIKEGIGEAKRKIKNTFDNK